MKKKKKSRVQRGWGSLGLPQALATGPGKAREWG